MPENSPSAGGLTAALFTVLIAGALGSSALGGNAGTSAGAAVAATQAVRADPPALAPPGRYERMGTRLLALARGDTAFVPRDSVFAAPQLDVLVATVPDPVDSHEDWVFDASLEALRRAHERAGYVIDRMWLPWTGRADSVLGDTLRTRLREAYPGVLLFRAAGTDSITPLHPQFRLVYLVGEVATAGVHPRALLNALDERRRLVGARTPDLLRVVGPTFSGSSAGLGRLLAAWRRGAGGRRVAVITGSATNEDNRRAFTDSVTFESTVNSNETLYDTLVSVVLPRLQIDTSELAILTEGSAYARQLGGGLADAQPGDSGADADRRPLRLTFPMNIGSLRAEGTVQDRAAAQARDPDGSVPLALSDAPRPMESPPVASRLTVAAIDLTLDQIAQTLRTRHVRAILIAATDVRDRIFLMTELRRRLRDVHFIALEANALYNAPEHREALRGMVVLSNYSLIAETQTWSGGPDVVSFSGEYAQGVYNATLRQLGRHDLLDYRYPARGAAAHPPVWITALGSTGMMPLAVIPTTDAYAATLPDSVAAAGPVAEPDPRGDFVAVASYMALLVIAGWLAVRSVLRLARIRGDMAKDADRLAELEEIGGTWLKGVRHARSVRIFRRVRWASLSYQRQLYRFLAAAAVAGGAIPAGAMYAAAIFHFDYLHRPGAWARTIGIVALLAALVSLLAVLLTAAEVLVWWLRYRKMFTARRRVARAWYDLWRMNERGRRMVLGLGILYLALTVTFAVESWNRAGDPDRAVGFTLLFYRATRLDSGLSPLAPLLLSAAGLLAWTHWHQRRVRSLRQMTAFEAAALSKNPAATVVDIDAGDDPCETRAAANVLSAIPPRAVRGVRQVRERLFRLVPDWRGAAVAAVLIAVSMYVGFGADPTLERLAGTVYFGALYLLGVAGMLAATGWGVYRMLTVWSGLRRVLRAMSSTPLVTAFERLPRRVSRLARLGFVGVPRSAIVAPISAMQWRHLVSVTRALELRPAAPAEAAPAGRDPQRQVAVLAVLGDDWKLVASGGQAGEAPTASTALAVLEAPPPRAQARPSGDEARLREAIAEYMTPAYLDRSREPETCFGQCGDEGPHGDHLVKLARVLEAFWEVEPDGGALEEVTEKLGKESRSTGPSASGHFRRSFGAPLRAWLAAAEEYAAVQVVDYVEWVVAQLRTLAVFIFVAMVLDTALLSAYPYERQSVVKLLFFVILVAGVGTLLRVSVEMNRDEVLSRVAKTEPGKLTWDRHFLVNAVVFGLIPVATLVSSEFPAVREFLFAWIYPLTRLLGGGG